MNREHRRSKDLKNTYLSLIPVGISGRSLWRKVRRNTVVQAFNSRAA